MATTQTDRQSGAASVTGQTDRGTGLVGIPGWKTPVIAATTANITLSGEQTIDGVAVVSGNRVLVKNQTDGTQNGIYDCATGSWTRAADFDGPSDVVSGSMVYVAGGTANGLKLWRLSTSDPIVIGTSTISFSEQVIVSDAVTPAAYGAAGDDTTDDTVAVQAAIDGLQANQTLFLDATYRITGGGLNITNKTDIHITGKGKLRLDSVASQPYVLKLVGTCTNVEISHIEIEGNANDAIIQEGIANVDSDTFSNIHIHDCTIHDVNIGILIGNPVGTYSHVKIHDNHLYNIVGTGPNQGVGIALNSTSFSSAYNNTVEDTERHALYISNGSHQRIYGNYVSNHRTAVADGSLRAAVSIARCTYCEFFDNTLYNYFDSGLGIEHVESESVNCTHIDVHHNKFYLRGNGPHDIYIGNQGLATSYKTSHVTIHDNEFIIDNSNTGANPAIMIHNGTDISIRNNKFLSINVDARERHITVGNLAYIDNVNDCTNVEVLDNIHQFEGTDTTDTRAITLDVDVTDTYTPIILVGRIRNGKGINQTIALDGSHTNTNCVIEDPEGVRRGIYADGDTTPSVYGMVNRLNLTNTGATTITDLDDGLEGQTVILTAVDGNTTLDVSGFYLAGNVNYTMGINDSIILQRRFGFWFEAGRMDYT